MDISRLFGVLVVGGAMVTGCGSDDGPAPPDARDPLASGTPDAAGTASDATAVDGGDVDGGELIECGFCPNDVCCEVDEEGNSTLKAGFECCWSTSC